MTGFALFGKRIFGLLENGVQLFDQIGSVQLRSNEAIAPLDSGGGNGGGGGGTGGTGGTGGGIGRRICFRFLGVRHNSLVRAWPCSFSGRRIGDEPINKFLLFAFVVQVCCYT